MRRRIPDKCTPERPCDENVVFGLGCGCIRNSDNKQPQTNSGFCRRYQTVCCVVDLRGGNTLQPPGSAKAEVVDVENDISLLADTITT